MNYELMVKWILCGIIVIVSIYNICLQDRLYTAKRGDINLDGRVDVKDLSIMSYYWSDK